MTHPVQSDVVIEIGDLLYLEGSTVKPASAAADAGTATANQAVFHDAFVGVAMQASPAGRAGSIRIATTGVFEFSGDAAVRPLGQLVGVAENAGGDALEDQKVGTVASVQEAIGRCAQRVDPASSRVLVDVVGTTTRGGPQEVA
ncbi:hypothetical protein [Botrimarina hoheduenensis]|uniref:hypothetical protein n=1 Tax=Botrimarina hoheduenensis TaxID=2528000 RepID=UPI0011B63B1C|nr:hypothetical protein [Botrimarina hoheduenensis]